MIVTTNKSDTLLPRNLENNQTIISTIDKMIDQFLLDPTLGQYVCDCFIVSNEDIASSKIRNKFEEAVSRKHPDVKIMFINKASRPIYQNGLNGLNIILQKPKPTDVGKALSNLLASKAIDEAVIPNQIRASSIPAFEGTTGLMTDGYTPNTNNNVDNATRTTRPVGDSRGISKLDTEEPKRQVTHGDIDTSGNTKQYTPMQSNIHNDGNYDANTGKSVIGHDTGNSGFTGDANNQGTIPNVGYVMDSNNPNGYNPNGYPNGYPNNPNGNPNNPNGYPSGYENNMNGQGYPTGNPNDYQNGQASYGNSPNGYGSNPNGYPMNQNGNQYNPSSNPMNQNGNQYNPNGYPMNQNGNQNGNSMNQNGNPNGNQYNSNGNQYNSNGNQYGNQNGYAGQQGYNSMQNSNKDSYGRNTIYDSNGNPVPRDANGNLIGESLNGVQFQYDENGNLIFHDSNGNPMLFDMYGRTLTPEASQDGTITGYDSNGNLVNVQYVTDQNGNSIPVTYDSKGNPIPVEMSYDSMGNPIINLKPQTNAMFTAGSSPIEIINRKTLVERLMEAGTVTDVKQVAREITATNLIKEMVQANSTYAGIEDKLKSLNEVIQSIMTDRRITTLEERLAKVRAVLHDKAFFREQGNTLISQRVEEIIKVLCTHTTKLINARLNELDEAIKKHFQVKNTAGCSPRLSGLDEQRANIIIELRVLEQEIVDLFQLTDSLVIDASSYIASEEKATIGDEEIYARLKAQGNIVVGNATYKAIQRLIDLSSDDIPASFKDMRRSVIRALNLLSRLFEYDAEIIAAQQAEIDYLRSKNVENTVIAQTLIKKSLRVFVGNEGTGRTIIPYLLSHYKSRQNYNVLMVDITGNSKLKDYDISYQDLDDYSIHLTEKHLNVVVGTVDNSIASAQKLITTLLKAADYYRVINVIMNPEQRMLIETIAQDILCVNYITDTNSSNIEFTKKFMEETTYDNVAQRVIINKCNVPIMPIIERLNIKNKPAVQVCSIRNTDAITDASLNGYNPYGISSVDLAMEVTLKYA